MRKAVLFDMDGVITDTERFYVDGMLDLLKRNGIHLEPTDLQEFFGSPLLHNCTVYGRSGYLQRSADSDRWSAADGRRAGIDP